MPAVRVVFYKGDDGVAPAQKALMALRTAGELRAFAKCMVRIERLAQMGHELRRPEADHLRDGIYELRARRGRVNYRVLYFFHGREVAVLTDVLTKEGAVPEAAILRAMAARKRYRAAPAAHTLGV